jgi:hypothetical protein
MTENSARRPQRCSFCGETGHNRRSCQVIQGHPLTLREANSSRRREARGNMSLLEADAARNANTTARRLARESLPPEIAEEERIANTAARRAARESLPLENAEEERVANTEGRREARAQEQPPDFRGWEQDWERARLHWIATSTPYEMDELDQAFSPVSAEEISRCMENFQAATNPNMPIAGCASCGVRCVGAGSYSVMPLRSLQVNFVSVLI